MRYANSKDKFPIQDIARSSNVTRWHSVNCYRFPSIAEHSYLVTMYSRELIDRIMPKATVTEKLVLLEFSLVHDLPEVLTGDMATPIKRRIESLYPDGESPLDKLEEDLCPDYKFLKAKIKGTPMQRIAKLADILEAIKFIDVEGKRQASCHSGNLQILEILKDMSSGLFENQALSGLLQDEIKAKLTEKIQNSLNAMADKEKNDSITRIKNERIEAYTVRVKQAQAEYPEYDWNHALEVLDQLLNAPQSQIDFIDG